jgi:hypothetical protein
MSLQVGQVYLYKGYPVYITGGQYMGTYGISNYWYWRKIKEDGTLGRSAKGYDNNGYFTEYPGNFEIIIKLKPNKKKQKG